MSAADLKAMREFLGLTAGWLAEYVGMSERRVQRFEVGKEELIPKELSEPLDALYDDTAETVARWISKYGELLKTRDTVEIPVYRDDGEYRRAHKHSVYPARWHRMVAQRVVDALPGCVLVYKEPIKVNRPPWLDEQGKPRPRANSSR
jgi:hypothetical protein